MSTEKLKKVGFFNGYGSYSSNQTQDQSDYIRLEDISKKEEKSPTKQLVEHAVQRVENARSKLESACEAHTTFRKSPSPNPISSFLSSLLDDSNPSPEARYTKNYTALRKAHTNFINSLEEATAVYSVTENKLEKSDLSQAVEESSNYIKTALQGLSKIVEDKFKPSPGKATEIHNAALDFFYHPSEHIQALIKQIDEAATFKQPVEPPAKTF